MLRREQKEGKIYGYQPDARLSTHFDPADGTGTRGNYIPPLVHLKFGVNYAMA
ncbi:hypothetical protein QJS10_CPA06g00480 [Acorus calamus]|uniref:Uncharacterized protein n=1 Tax=Acorus calamus TaxID=4465 RepID=A0AAV9E1S9_ACOCL|nr:hypothetical protein QJS10_CPA10g01060 [Acorus calamus]KAK1315090.1 hypothetical protein QJS10_CPA06g00480 [Acorus calamus]